jgi:hypothetical protein
VIALSYMKNNDVGILVGKPTVTRFDSYNKITIILFINLHHYNS